MKFRLGLSVLVVLILSLVACNGPLGLVPLDEDDLALLEEPPVDPVEESPEESPEEPMDDGTGEPAGEEPPAEPPSEPGEMTVLNDDVRNQAVFVSENNEYFDIISTEDGGVSVSCVYAIDLVALVDPANTGVKALVLGYRDDGKAGLWEIHSDNTVHPLSDTDEGQNTSRLPESHERDYAMARLFGWEYYPKAMSDDGRIVVGYAENVDGYSHGRWTIDPGTTVGIYWVLGPVEDGRVTWASRARIIGAPLSIDDTWSRWRRRVAHFIRFILGSLRFFFLDYFDNYLTYADNITTVQPGEYTVIGPDKEGVESIATLGWWFVQSIEPYGPPSSDKELVSFDFLMSDNPGLTSDVIGEIAELDVTATFPAGTDVTSLVPTVIYIGESIDPDTGVSQDFSSAIMYTITAEDGSTLSYIAAAEFEIGNNLAPSASFPAADLWVSGGGNPSLDGYYDDRGIMENGRPSFLKQDSLFYLFSTLTEGLSHWSLHTSVLSPMVSTDLQNTVSYYLPDNAGYPPTDGWFTGGAGTPPAPRILEVPITGDITTPGATVEAVYEFSDPDGDAEGISTFRWFRVENGITSEILGEIQKYYVLPADTGNYQLQVEVTPVDERGLAGAPELSGLSRFSGGS